MVIYKGGAGRVKRGGVYDRGVYRGVYNDFNVVNLNDNKKVVLPYTKGCKWFKTSLN